MQRAITSTKNVIAIATAKIVSDIVIEYSIAANTSAIATIGNIKFG